MCKADGRIVCKRTGDVRLITDNTHWKSQVRHTLYTGNDKFRRCEDDPDYWETVPAHGEAREQQAMAPGLQALVAASALAQQDAAAAAGISVKEESCSLDTGPQGPQAQQQQQLQSHGRTSQGREASSSDTTSAVAPLPVEASSMSAAAAAAAQTTGGEDSSAERGQAAAPGPSSTATGGRQRPRKALRAKPIIEKQRRSPARPSTGRALRGRGTPEPAQAAATQQQQQAVMQALQMQVQPMVMPFMQAAGGGAGGSAAAGQLPPLAALAAMLQQYGMSIVPTASLTGAAAAAAAAAGAGTSTGGGQGGVHSPSAAAGAPLQPGAQVPAAGMVQAPPSVAQLQVGSIQMFAPQVGSAGGGMDAHAAMQMVAALMGGTAARPATPT